MLSDACSAFLAAFDKAAESLISATDWYSSLDYAILYGKEADPLRRACDRARLCQDDNEARVELVRAASLVMRRLDAEPAFDKLIFATIPE